MTPPGFFPKVKKIFFLLFFLQKIKKKMKIFFYNKILLGKLSRTSPMDNAFTQK
jgi:hypothetical protein